MHGTYVILCYVCCCISVTFSRQRHGLSLQCGPQAKDKSYHASGMQRGHLGIKHQRMNDACGDGFLLSLGHMDQRSEPIIGRAKICPYPYDVLFLLQKTKEKIT